MVDLALTAGDVSLAPLPLRAGFPFTVTAVIHNQSELPADDVPVMVYLAANQEELSYTTFLQVITVSVPISQSVAVSVPIHWNLPGGEQRLWLQVNRVPHAWSSRLATQPETDLADNTVLLDLVVDPFDAYVSELCAGRVDLEVGPADVLPDLESQQVIVQVHNPGNQAVYNVAVVAVGRKSAGVAYTPAIPPCGGTAQVHITLDRPFQEGDQISIQVNPMEWESGPVEDNYDNNHVSVSAGLAGASPDLLSGLQEYDFAIDGAEIEIPQAWVVLVKVHNLGTRDAAGVPIHIENEAGRKLDDVIPLVQGSGSGVAAIRVGYLWTKGGTLTFTINPAQAKGAYPESNLQNNVTTFVLP